MAVIPAYNEEQTIKEVIAITARYVDQVIVIDDGSKDSTARQAEIAGADVGKTRGTVLLVNLIHPK